MMLASPHFYLKLKKWGLDTQAWDPLGLVGLV